MLPGNDLGNQTSETQMPNGRGASLVLPLPSNGSLSNKRFRLVLAGRVSTAINTTLTLNVYFGISTKITSNTQIFTTNAQTVNAKSTNFSITIDMYWSNTGKLINGGPGQGQVDNNPVGPSSLLNTPSADPFRDDSTFLASGPTYGFTVTGQFGNSDAGNHAFAEILELEEL
jgi:hypothetical protein